MIRLDPKSSALVMIDVPEDLCASMGAELHAFAVSRIFPRIARVGRSAEIELQP